jgi:hypothetical protein
MKLGTTYEFRPGYLYVNTTGRFDPQSAEEIFLAGADIARSRKLTRILWDFTLVTARHDQAASQRRWLETGAFAAKGAPLKIKVAILETPQQLLSGRYGEKEAVRNGVSIKVTSGLREALEWLGVGAPESGGAKTRTP